MSFLNELKIAVINRDLEKLEKLSNQMPEITSIKEANELLNYLVEAKRIIENEKDNLRNSMNEIKKIKKFYDANSFSKFNLKF